MPARAAYDHTLWNGLVSLRFLERPAHVIIVELVGVGSSLSKAWSCGVRVEEIEDPLMKKIRYMDKLIDEIAKGRAIEKILGR